MTAINQGKPWESCVLPQWKPEPPPPPASPSCAPLSIPSALCRSDKHPNLVWAKTYDALLKCTCNV